MKLRSQFQVLLIDSKDYWEYTPSLPRTLIQPERIKYITVPHEKNLKKEQFLRGTFLFY